MVHIMLISVAFVVLFHFISTFEIISGESAEHEQKKYTKASQWSHYLEKIEKAVSDFVDCTNEDCACFSSVIRNDLAPWKKGISSQEFDSAKKRGVHYQVINHKLYRQESCLFPFRCKGVEHFILELIDELPDLELVINVNDWPQASRHGTPYPVFSFSKVMADYWDIMYPAWTFWEGGPAVWPIYPTGLGRWDLQKDIIAKEAEKWPWEKKLDTAFFRGSRTSAERDPLILLSRKEPDLVEAQYTKNQAWKSDADTLNRPPAEEIRLEEHCKYRYLFNFRGVAASFRFKHLFMCNSTVFHVGDEWLEFFYPALKPWVHFVPVRQNLKNVRELLMFARENQKEMQNMAERGRRFIAEHLCLEDVSCYWRKLLLNFSKLLKFKPKRNKSYQQIIPS